MSFYLIYILLLILYNSISIWLYIFTQNSHKKARSRCVTTHRKYFKRLHRKLDKLSNSVAEEIAEELLDLSWEQLFSDAFNIYVFNF